MIGDDTIIKAVDVGIVKLQAHNGSEWIECSLNNVLFVPKLAVNLISARAAVDKGYLLQMNNEECKFVKNGIVGEIAKRENNTYVMDFWCYEIDQANVGRSCVELREWHSKLIHQNVEQVKNILENSIYSHFQ